VTFQVLYISNSYCMHDCKAVEYASTSRLLYSGNIKSEANTIIVYDLKDFI